MDRQSLADWVHHLGDRDLPLLQGTAAILSIVDANPQMSMRALGRLVQRDPGLALKLIRVANGVPHRHFRTEVVALDEAVMMIGTDGLKRAIQELEKLPDVLSTNAQSYYRYLAGRVAYAATLAEAWAENRHDMIPSEVGLAALLYDLGELVWTIHDERRMARYMELVRDGQVLPHEAEYVALDVSLETVGHALAERWQLPAMVRECMCPANARHARAMGVMLASNLARDAMAAWDHPGVGGNLDQAARYLDCSSEELADYINGATEHFNAHVDLYGLDPVPLLDEERVKAYREKGARPPEPVFCLMPRSDRYEQARSQLASHSLENRDQVLDVLLEGLHEGLGLNRVVFARLSDIGDTLSAERMEGTDHEPAFNRFELNLAGGHLIAVMMKRPSAFWLNPSNCDEVWPRVPHSMRTLIGVREFFAHSVFVGDQPYGLVYADRRSEVCALDRRALKGFKTLVELATAHLESLRQAGRGRL
ncbi:HDOD domain-containing protein [Ectothiorhodospira variabilis]|uniref:HDOD domain-containing protein n=1 Tax=Ectothiorhodospira variabilis TaxID=505694 RepID=UPI001EFA9031|nr:HDOD domain-containing protein [Ectothiorhodospira variabilis]MCG5498163.1 HDOD domain-containing protein [Ectothiorhodospira variabilis]